MTTLSGFGAKPYVTQLPSGRWQVVVEPLDPVAKELLPDQPLIGYGETEQEACLDGVQAFARSLNKLTPEDRSRIGLSDLEGGKLVGAVDNERAVPAEEVEQFIAEREAKKRKRLGGG